MNLSRRSVFMALLLSAALFGQAASPALSRSAATRGVKLGAVEHSSTCDKGKSHGKRKKASGRCKRHAEGEPLGTLVIYVVAHYGAPCPGPEGGCTPKESFSASSPVTITRLSPDGEALSSFEIEARSVRVPPGEYGILAYGMPATALDKVTVGKNQTVEVTLQVISPSAGA